MSSYWPEEDVRGFQSRSSYWTGAAVCRRGHVLSSFITMDKAPPSSEKCARCGADILIACGSCGRRIRGGRFSFGVVTLGRDYTPPGFCDGCGAAYPWATWEQRLWALENMLDDEHLDEPTRLRVARLLDEVRNEGMDFEADREQKVWGRIRDAWPGLTEKAWAIAAPLITAEAKRKLGLPPG